jgi:hypothetical protein
MGYIDVVWSRKISQLDGLCGVNVVEMDQRIEMLFQCDQAYSERRLRESVVDMVVANGINVAQRYVASPDNQQSAVKFGFLSTINRGCLNCRDKCFEPLREIVSCIESIC